MMRWLRRLAIPLFVLAMAGGLTGCDQGNGVNCVQSPMLQTTVCLFQ